MSVEKRLSDMNELGPFIEDNIGLGKKVKLTITGDSMYPLFKSRIDTVVLDIPDKIGKYDIIFYKRKNGSYVLHRILKEKRGTFVVAGDNETVKEYPVTKDQIIGKVIEFHRKGKKHKADELFYRFYGFVWVNIFPIRYIVLRYAMKIYRFIKKNTHKKVV